jgi:putative transposase
MLSENKKKYQGKIYKKNGKLTKGFIRYNNKRAKKRLQQTQYMKKLTRKRNNKVKDYMHKASRYIVNWCIEHKIGTIIIGKNDKWKQRVNLGKKTNQSFVQLPFNMLIEKIDYKAELAGIKVKTTTEEYTSQTCFKCGLVDKTNRKHRGLYVCPDCEIEINADVNAAYNIMKKVFPNSIAVEGIEGTQLYPTLINLGKDS